jgi:transposase
MHIIARNPEDMMELKRRLRAERNAEQRDRYRAALLAIAGDETQQIMDKLGRSRGFVQRWAYAYRDHGIDALVSKLRGGSQPKISHEQQKKFIVRFKAGPTEADHGMCRLGGKEAVRILEEEFGVAYSLNGAYKLLHRNGLSCLRPRPQHRKSNPQVQQQWVEQAPLLSKKSALCTLASKSKSGSKTKHDSANKVP